MADDNNGYLTVAVTTAISAIPLKNADVVISKTVDGVTEPVFILKTDISGKTEKVPLPSPPRENSLTPAPQGPSYALYTITAYKEGYYPGTVVNVPIFADITSLQNMVLYPLTAGNFIGIRNPAPQGTASDGNTEGV